MFTTLIESKPKKQRRSAGTAASVALHLGLLVFAVVATANARSDAIERSREEKLNYVEVKKAVPKPEEPKPKPEEPKPEEPKPVSKATPTPPQAPRVETPAPPKGFQVLQAPVNIPINIPEIDLSAAVTNESDFSGKGVAGGGSKGVEGGTGDADSKGTAGGLSNQPYFEFQVEEAASPSGGNAEPQYPASMRESGMTGRVVVQYVVGANGRVEPGSIKVLEATNSAFAAAVRDVLPRHRFSPAKIGGTAVRQIVQQPFVFKLNT